MLIWEVEGTKPLTPDQSQARALDQVVSHCLV